MIGRGQGFIILNVNDYDRLRFLFYLEIYLWASVLIRNEQTDMFMKLGIIIISVEAILAIAHFNFIF